MATIQEELVRYGAKLEARDLAAGTCGSISARDPKQIVWVQPHGFAMDELEATALCGVHLSTGKQTKGIHKPPSEVRIHIAVYRSRPDAGAVFHVHPPWLSGIVNSGVPFRPLTSEAALSLGRILTMPYVEPTTPELAEQVGEAVGSADTLLLAHYGMLVIGANVREAYHRCVIAENAAKSIVAAAALGEPRYLAEEQIEAIRTSGS
jgi:L-fuculose-phosphate aldolase